MSQATMHQATSNGHSYLPRLLVTTMLVLALGPTQIGCIAPTDEEDGEAEVAQVQQPLSFMPRLPYPAGTTMGVSQGWGGSWSHSGNLYYGIDFSTSNDLGLHVLAVADGVVTFRYDDCSCDGCSCNSGWGNAIVIDHGNGEFSKYTHFQYDSIPNWIQLGTTVCRGLHIGNIGSTGYSTGPHLHFQFQSDGSLSGPSIPFDKFAETSGVPQEGGSYTSSNQELSQCGPPEPCEVTVEGAETVIDDQTDCLTRIGAHWWEEPSGHSDHHWFTYTIDEPNPDSSATWEVNVGAAGNYQVEAFIPNNPDNLTQGVPYVVRHDGVQDSVTVDQSAHRGSWVALGTYAFAAGGDQWVRIADNSGEPYVDENGPRLVVDALRFTVPGQCADECESGKRCIGPSWEECGNFDDDACLEWGNATACESGTHCEGDGQCLPGDDPDPDTDDPDTDPSDGVDVGLPPSKASSGLEGFVCTAVAPGSTGGTAPGGAFWWLLLGLAWVRLRRAGWTA
ncbi:MAG: peptidoglycan DD-metalloendopeptidase family protein [Deltaproteobacteria bacterium]|nr:peptidoglycan DD-metalloendopeptidase family protein [Deltaproteobacteria bacterium]